MDGVESSTNELPLSALTFGSWPDLAGAGAGAECGGECSAESVGRRQRHGIAGQMSYLKMLGLGARGRLAAAGLFSTAVISGSSSAPNLRVMIPTSTATNAALEGFGGVPAIRPLETLHNALSLRQLDAFLERVTAAPVLLPTHAHKHVSPTNSVGWSGPSSLMSSSGELPSGLSSAGPSSPNSNYASNSDHKNNSTESNWSRGATLLPQWEGDAGTLCALDAPLRPFLPHPSLPGSSVSGDVTPVSITSELDFNSNEATAGSITDHDLLSAGEDDEETLSADPCGSPMNIINNDLSPQTFGVATLRPDNQPSTSSTIDFYGLNLQQTKENLYKDIPSSSKNFNIESNVINKCTKDNAQCSNYDVLKESNKSKSKRNELLNNCSRRYSDSVTQKSSSSNVAGSRFKTTLVAEDTFRPSTSGDNKSNSTTNPLSQGEITPLITKAKNLNIKPGFTITDK